MNKEIIIKCGTVYDSVSRAFYKGDVVIGDGKIQYAGPSCEWDEGSEGCEVIWAEGKIVSPGFLDIHSHEDNLGKSGDCIVAKDMLRMGVTTCVAGNCGTMFQPLKEYISYAEKPGIPTNYVFFTGYNFLRSQKVDIYKKAGDEDLKELAAEIRQDLDRGAIGISLGLEYAPGVAVQEVVTLCQLVGRDDIRISIHIRSDREASIPAVQEAIDIAEKTGLPVGISHIGSMAAYGQIREVYRCIEAAVNRGLRISVDCYPYNAFCTGIGSAVFDEQALAAGNFKFENLLFATGPFAGKICTEEMYRISRRDYPKEFVVGYGMDEDEVRYALSHHLTMIGSDGFVIGNSGHPRTAGTFPRVLGKYVREEKIVSLEDALCKMTAMPAAAIGAKNKGALAAGMDADIVIFDREQIIDRADYQNVNTPPDGIEMVILNGRIALRGQTISEPYCGTYLKKEDIQQHENKLNRH